MMYSLVGDSVDDVESPSVTWRCKVRGAEKRSESNRILDLAGQSGSGRAEFETTALVLKPALIEDKKKIIARADDPAHAALPAEVALFVVELHEIEDREKRREGIVCAQLEDAGHEVALFEPHKGLFQPQPDLKMRRGLVLKGRLELLVLA